MVGAMIQHYRYPADRHLWLLVFTPYEPSHPTN